MIFAAALGILSVVLAPVVPLVMLGGVLVWIGANRVYDKISRKRK